ncbi:MBL fold metallo-hydrolase [Roseinatronobacter bogoriensis]|nr:MULTISPECIES: MBL fold metallo-hydrolase [Rhodobaca]MBB4206648.1 glyoxylase-like metal-dependent hydrolase (beta-lactamase superfamily II) [Rhodobaca bogoriensis DSM 18756]TDW41392.1 glyoxylase-like metal-dependent hydrolase (beta-lactamase superfamily II) [Rhodobaca barguzinensis]TDY74430.1 glyoxylase-like metal-dependent hydrolase (beta-lactamase superfamily II) [Rhodobaca bogoriensis DSM 18756]
MKRRSFMQSTGAVALAMSLPRQLQARTTWQQDGTRIDMLSDGYLELPADMMLENMPQDELAEILARYDLNSDQLEPPCNLVLLRDGPRVVLFDIGAGPDFMPSVGHMMQAMESLGVSPDDITHLVITHAHPDHIWGLLDDFDEPMLPNAEVMMGRAEWEYWMDPDTVESIGAARQSFAVGAQRRLVEVQDHVTLFDDGAEVLPGVEAISTPGHTPGHMSFALNFAGQQLIVTGDALVNHHLAFERPEWLSGSDHDLEQAAQTRLRLLDRITADDLTILGFHLPEGGMGRAERLAENRYRFHAGA